MVKIFDHTGIFVAILAKIEGGTDTQFCIFATFCDRRFCLDFLAVSQLEKRRKRLFSSVGGESYEKFLIFYLIIVW